MYTYVANIMFVVCLSIVELVNTGGQMICRTNLQARFRPATMQASEEPSERLAPP